MFTVYRPTIRKRSREEQCISVKKRNNAYNVEQSLKKAILESNAIYESESEEEIENIQQNEEKVSELTKKIEPKTEPLKETSKENIPVVTKTQEMEEEIVAPKKIYQLPESVLHLKDKATGLFSNGQYGEAIEYYTKSIDKLKAIKASSEDMIDINKNLFRSELYHITMSSNRYELIEKHQ